MAIGVAAPLTDGDLVCPVTGAGKLPGDIASRQAHEATSRPRAPGILLGIGLGGFVDGIVLHQLLQWHHMLISEGSYPQTTVAGLETNTLWDGIFHASTWIAVAAGIYIFGGARPIGAGRSADRLIPGSVEVASRSRDDVPWRLLFSIPASVAPTIPVTLPTRPF